MDITAKKTDAFALITGASGGIGLEFARQLAAQGWNLMLAARRFSTLNEIARDLEAAWGIRALPLHCDLSLPHAAEDLFTAATARGKVEILINNAGVGSFGLCENMGSEEVANMLTLNCISLTALSNLFAKHFKEKNSGYILNVSSLAGNWPQPYFAAYAATKAYVTSYTVGLSVELKHTAVSVTCFLPGFVATSFDENANISSEAYRKFSKKFSMGPKEVARQGLKLMFRKKYIGIAGWTNAMASFFNSLLSRKAQANIVYNTVRRLLR